MKAACNGVAIAESDDTVIVESNHYFPRGSLVDEYFEHSETTSHCPWKGDANYLTVVVDGERNPDSAWYYSEPKEAARQIIGRVAFWRGVVVSE